MYRRFLIIFFLILLSVVTFVQGKKSVLTEAQITLIDSMITANGGGGADSSIVNDLIGTYLDTANISGASYTLYSGFISQSSTASPVADVLESTFDSNPVWSRISTGNYRATLTDAFTINKTMILLNAYNTGGATIGFAKWTKSGSQNDNITRIIHSDTNGYVLLLRYMRS